jgi:hypothetical protein
VLQLIDEGDQPARRQPEGLGDHALIHAGRLSQDTEHPRVPWSEAERLQALREPSRGVRAQLGEEHGCESWTRDSGSMRRHFATIARNSSQLASLQLVTNVLVMPSAPVHPSPPLVLLASVHAALFLASLVAAAVLSKGGHVPSPFSPPGEALSFFSNHPAAVRWSAFLQLGATVPLALFAGVVASRLAFLGLGAAGVHIALAGGLLGAAALGVCALAQWPLSWSEVAAAPGAARGLQLMMFGAGGPAAVMFTGLLVAGVSVTTGAAGLLPRWLSISGVVLAVLAQLSWFSLIFPPALVLLPLARFPTLLWLILAGAMLPVARAG